MNQETLEIIVKVLAKKIDEQERLLKIYFERVTELEDKLAKIKKDPNDNG